MASYRYERDIDPKDLQPRKQRQYTRKERWANWWDYNLKWVIIIGIIVVFFGYNFIGQYFFTVHADYNVAVVAPHYLPEATQTALQDALAAYGEDRNGDGKVVVKLNLYTMDFGNEDSDAYLDMAGTTKLSTDIQGALSSIFILYDPAGFQQTTGTLRYLDTDMRLVGQWKPGTADAPVEEFHSDDRLLEVADEALANAGITHITGIIASGNYFVDTPQKVEEVIRLTGADAVEMEGAAVAQVAARNDVPALVIRALSDNADTDYEVFKDFDISEYADTAARLAVDIVKRL